VFPDKILDTSIFLSFFFQDTGRLFLQFSSEMENLNLIFLKL